ncbi:MAG: hypothetical protein U9R21_03415, partial [Candidatus Thermoplasmatota archaeon]|nr:hypothetical protein [Candidatus Thermoplasmatota archaeon]
RSSVVFLTEKSIREFSYYIHWMDDVHDVPNKVRQYLHDLEKENQILKGENQQFREVLPRFEKKLKDLEKENKELKDEIDKLEKKLRIYQNPHTPSSKQRFKKKLW